ncbi:hypothetical protein QTP88_013593 [Uroleucon formosanum]
MYREYDDQILRDYFDVSVMDVITTLLDESELQYSINFQPEDIDNEDEAFNREMDDFVVLMVSVAVIALDEILEEIGDGDGMKTEDKQVNTGTRRRSGGIQEFWIERLLFWRPSSEQKHIQAMGRRGAATYLWREGRVPVLLLQPLINNNGQQASAPAP